MAWLEEATQKVAEAAGLEAASLGLPPGVRREILDLARIASHASGERINAPLLCYVLGLAVARGAALEEVAAAVRSLEA
jgi:hypothetical protein